MKKINICFVIASLNGSGPVKILYNIIKYLDKSKFNIILVTLHNSGELESERKFKMLGIDNIKLNLSKMGVFFFNVSKIEKILKEKQIQIVHSHCVLSSYLVSKLRGVKKIATIHCNPRKDFRLKRGVVKGKIMEKIYFRALKDMDNRICCGKGVMQEIATYSKLEFKYIQNGIDLENFDNLDFNNKGLELDISKKYFISVGSLIKRKNPVLIAKAFDEMKLENFKLIFLGTGPERIKIEKLNNKDIILLGNVSNVNEYLKACDYFISASFFEGLPNSVMEACAMGLPCVLSQIGPHKEILELGNKEGVFFNPSDKNQLKKVIKRILTFNYKDYSENSIKIVRDYLNAKNMGNNYENRYFKLIEESNKLCTK